MKNFCLSITKTKSSERSLICNNLRFQNFFKWFKEKITTEVEKKVENLIKWFISSMNLGNKSGKKFMDRQERRWETTEGKKRLVGSIWRKFH